MDFQVFKTAVAKQFQRLQEAGLLRVSAERDALWDLYLAAFPAGSNPIFRERTEHDCSCCRGFIKAVGNAVAIIDGKLETVWQINISEPAYQSVANALDLFVRGHQISDTFLHYEAKVGTDKSFEDIAGNVKTWDHFHAQLKPQYVKKGADIPTLLNEARTPVQLFQRALETISQEAVETTLELIAQGSLYRGEEQKFVVNTFASLLAQYRRLNQGQKDLFVWLKRDLPASVLRIRNSAIGTLLQNLSEGMDLEPAVKAWETVMAPTNYKRPTALVTPKMVEQAKATIAELGLTSALERRHATLTDITVNNILFANRDARKVMDGDVFDALASEVSSKTKKLDKLQEIPIEKFLAEVLPTAASIEVLLENRHQSNLVSLVAPVDPTAGRLFKWDNNFSWSYNGDVTDAIKERVKAAGGSVIGDVLCRLAWDNTDDLDLHMHEPMGEHIYFHNRRSRNGGQLDVDANGIDGIRVDPVENIFYRSKVSMSHGTYKLVVNQYNPRGTSSKGFTVEVEIEDNVHTFRYDKALRRNESIEVAQIIHSREGFEVKGMIPSTQASRQMWNLPTQTYHKVNVLLLSPNQWDDRPVGNKHYLFMLDRCQAETPARGFYNEFLQEDLTKHRKVFEIVGSKMRTAETPEQLSGLGFSSTQPNHLVVRVTGAFTRDLKIVF